MFALITNMRDIFFIMFVVSQCDSWIQFGRAFLSISIVFQETFRIFKIENYVIVSTVLLEYSLLRHEVPISTIPLK